MPAPTWSAPVRFVEVDSQDVVFNAHYLTWCDEAMNAFLVARGLRTFATLVRLVTSTLTWTSSAVWGDVVDVDVRCTAVGRTSLTLVFELRVGDRVCCTVHTVYVYVGSGGTSSPVPDDVRAALTG